MRRFLASLLLLLVAGSADARMSSRVAVTAATANFNGDGWVQSCWSNFSVENYLTQSNSFTTSPWTAASSGGPAVPTVTANTTDVTSPDGSNDATRVDIPAVTSPSQTSYIVQFPEPNGYLSNTPYNLTLWMRGAVGGEKTYLEFDDRNGVNFFIPVTLSTNWQLYTLSNIVATINFGTPFLGNTSRSGMVSTAAGTVYIWHAQMALAGVPYSYIATTSSQGTANIRAACPPNVRFRDFRNLVYSTQFQPLLLAGSNTWNSGFDPLVASLRSWQLIGGTYYGLFYGGSTATTCSPNPGCYLNTYTGADPWHLSDPGGGVNPSISPASGAWDDHYVYSATWSPKGVNGANYAIFYSARSSADADAIGLATASSPSGPWTKYASNPIISGLLNPSVMLLPNGSFRMDTIQRGSQWMMTSTSSDGLTWGPFAIALQDPTTADWDTTDTIEAEDYVFRNTHGFCEAMVMEQGAIQEGAYAVAASCDPTTPAGQVWYRTPYNPGLTYPARSFPRANTGFGCPAIVERRGDLSLFICGVDSTIAPTGGTWHATMPNY